MADNEQITEDKSARNTEENEPSINKTEEKDDAAVEQENDNTDENAAEEATVNLEPVEQIDGSEAKESEPKIEKEDENFENNADSETHENNGIIEKEHGAEDEHVENAVGDSIQEENTTVAVEQGDVLAVEIETQEKVTEGENQVGASQSATSKEEETGTTVLEDTADIHEIDGIVGKEKEPVTAEDIEEIALTTPPPESVAPENDVILEENEDEAAELQQAEDQIIYETESVEEYPIYDREQLLQQYKDALEERSKIQQSNQQYQHKLAEYFKKKKTDDRAQEIEKNVTDQEQRYLKYMSNLEELQAAEERQANGIEIQLEELKDRCQEKQDKVEKASDALMTFKYDVAKNAINSRSGKSIPVKDIEQYQSLEAKKEQEVITVRLENIKLKNRLKKREQQLKAKEELAEGLHLIDFEQLKIENQTYNEKIEERNEELLKLRRKITTTVQVLTHLKEKLQFVQGENGEQRSKLRDIEVTVAHRRDILTRLKQVRDGLRMDNNKLKYKSGLLGNKPLLRDFEERKDEGEGLRSRLQNLREQHIELNMNLTGIRKKIEKSKPAKVT